MAGAAARSACITAIDPHHSACRCVDALPVSYLNLNFRSSSSSGDFRQRSLELSSSFVGTWHGRRPSSVAHAKQQKKKKSRGRFVVVDELAGQYEEGFEDVNRQVINYFTYKAVRTVLHQLYEMNPPNYRWFYDFVAANKPNDAKLFLRSLGKERQDLAERVMITRLHLYGKWIKKLDHAQMYQKISDENLELMRERLTETVIWPSESDDTGTGVLGFD